MTGSKTAKKKKTPSAADSPELKAVQAWVAEGLKAGDLASHVGRDCQDTTPRLQLLGRLYLLLKRWPSEGASDEQMQQLQQLLEQAADEHGASAATGHQPSLVLVWAAVQAFSKLAAGGSDQQLQWCKALIGFVQPTLKALEAQPWLEQWQPPLDYPAAPEQEPAAKNPQRLAATLGTDMLLCYKDARMQAMLSRDPDTPKEPTIKSLSSLIAELEAEAKETAAPAAAAAAKAEPKAKAVPKAKAAAAAAGKKDDKAPKDKKKAAEQQAALAQQLTRETSHKQQPQQQKRSKDADKAAAALRGTAGDEKAAKELADRQEYAAKAQEKADEVLAYLSKHTLTPSQSQAEHMSALASKVRIEPVALQKSLTQLKSHDPHQAPGSSKDAKKGGEAKAGGGNVYEERQAQAILRLFKDQFGNPAGDAQVQQLLVSQLEAAVDSGSWMVYAEGEEGVRPSKDRAYFASLAEFQQHAQKEYLDGKHAVEDLKTYGMVCAEAGPGLLDAYNADFGPLLADDAAKELQRMGGKKGRGGSDQANGVNLEDNPWMQTFAEDCPLRRYLLHANRTPTSFEEGLPSVVALPGLVLDQIVDNRSKLAAGFALLQLQRGQIVVTAEDLSTAPDWQVKAYQSLKLLLPLFYGGALADPLDFVIFNYFNDPSVTEAVQDLAEILDPDLQAQAGGEARGFSAAAAPRGPFSSTGSSSDPSFSAGLVQDTVIMLQMLHEAKGLAEGPLQLALQVYACKASGKPLPLPGRHTESFKAAKLAAALEEGFDRSEQLELRSFILQVLPAHFARLPKYVEFLEAAVRDKRWRDRYVPVEATSSGNSKSFALSPAFYAQACMAAAVPYEENRCCCAKHVQQRELAEAEGQTFSRATADTLDVYQCVGQVGSIEKVKGVQRYMLEAARVTQAQQQKELHPGTEAGLAAVTRELFVTSEYDEPMPPEHPDTLQPNVGWGLCRFYLLLASQLAIARQQLHQLILFHEHNLTNGRTQARDLRKAERAILQQRIAGMYFCYGAWNKWHTKIADQLTEELSALAKAGKGPQAADKAGGKAGGKESAREAPGHKGKNADALHENVERARNSVAHLENATRQLVKQADMCAASAEAMATSLTDPARGMEQTIELVMRQLLNPRPAPDALQTGRLTKALQLSRQTLFELDVTITAYVNLAHSSVLGNMWRWRQPAAAVSLARYALGQHVLSTITEARMNELMLEDDEPATAKAAGSKAGGKKKKKKGPATVAKKVSALASDDEKEASDEEKEEAAAAAAESEGEGEEGMQQTREPDLEQLVNFKALEAYEHDRRAAAAAEASSSSHRSSGSAAAAAAASSASRAAAAAAADAGAGFKPAGRAGAAAAGRPGSSRGQPQQQQQPRRDKALPPGSALPPGGSKTGPFTLVNDLMWVGPGPHGEAAFKTRDGPVCWECGLIGHVPAACDTPRCRDCGRYGHWAEQCRDACRKCGFVHRPLPDGKCFAFCRMCGLYGHSPLICPSEECNYCHRFGHRTPQCAWCPRCKSYHDRGLTCCDNCKQLGHKAADCRATQCAACKQWDSGCFLGDCKNPHLANRASSSSSTAAANRAPVSSSSSAGSRGPSKPPTAAGLPPLPANVTLLSAAALAALPPSRDEALINQLLEVGLESVIAQLMEDTDKRAELLRVPDDVMKVWLAHKDAGSYVQGMLDHFAACRAGGEASASAAPAHLSDAGAALFEAEYNKVPGSSTLPGNWRDMSWKDLEKELAPRSAGHKAHHHFKAAKRKAIDATAAAGGTQRRSGSARQEPPPRPSQQQQQQRAGEEPPSGPRDSSASGGADADMAAWAPPQEGEQQQEQGAPAAAAAAAGRRQPQSAMAALVEEKRRLLQQPAALALHMQQQQGVGPVHNSYSTPQIQLPPPPLPPHQLVPPVGVADPAVAAAEQRIGQEPLAAWMLWFIMGASRAVEELVPHSSDKMVLLQVLDTAGRQDSTHMDLEALKTAVLAVLPSKIQAPPEERHAWITLGRLIDVALQEGSPVPRCHQQQQQQHYQQQQHTPMAAPAPAAAAAPGPMLPPHLRHMAGVRGGLPPHLQQQAQQQQHQQQAAAAADESSDDDDDTLLGMLGVESTPAAAAAAADDGAMSGWAAVTGHAHEEDAGGSLSSGSFPPLGGGAPGEDADYERALAASRADQAAQQQRANVPGVSAAGLANQTGEYNCFLNVVVQCLWNCKAFTQQVGKIASEYDKHPVVVALLGLFERMEVAESGWQPGHARAVIDPTELRIALAKHTPFKCQEMNDANELLDTIYECFAQSQSPGQQQGSRGIMVDSVFGLLVSEKVVCQACGMQTHKVPEHYEHLVVVNSINLTLLASQNPTAGMDILLRNMFDQEHKMCDKDEGGCGYSNARHRTLEMGPQVLTLQLVWDQSVSGDEIRATLSLVEERLDITHMYNDMKIEDTTFQLTSAVAYYGQHYMAFVFSPQLHKWLMFDDASVSDVGTWQDVVSKCQAGKIQPGVLFYTLDVSEVAGSRQPLARQQVVAPPVVQHMPSSSSSSAASGGGGHYAAAPGAGSHHGFPPAAAAAPTAGGSGLPASSSWGANRARAPAAAAAAAAGSGPPSTGSAGWGDPAKAQILAAAGMQAADSAGMSARGMVDPRDSWGVETTGLSQLDGDAGSWAAGGPASSSGSFGSAAGGGGRASSSGVDGWAAGPPRPTAATGPGAAGAPAGRLAGRAFGELRHQGPTGTGPRAANSAGPVGMDRSSGGGVGNSAAPPGGYAGGGRGAGRAGGRGPGTGRGVGGGGEAEWEGGPSGRGPRGRAGGRAGSRGY